MGADELWDRAEEAMSDVLKQIAGRSGGKIKTGINPGEGAFYGPKFEYVLRDAIGRDWQCGTIQVDFNLPERFGAFYIDADGEKKTPVMIHRAMFGSMERFAGILLENTAGHLPLWLAPVQAKVCTIVSDADAYAEEVLAELKAKGLRAEIDLRNEKINYKVREHSLAKVPVLLGGGQARGRGEDGLRAPARHPAAAGHAAGSGHRRVGRRGRATGSAGGTVAGPRRMSHPGPCARDPSTQRRLSKLMIGSRQQVHCCPVQVSCRFI